jgi:hypothetical protein
MPLVAILSGCGCSIGCHGCRRRRMENGKVCAVVRAVRADVLAGCDHNRRPDAPTTDGPEKDAEPASTWTLYVSTWFRGYHTLPELMSSVQFQMLLYNWLQHLCLFPSIRPFSYLSTVLAYDHSLKTLNEQ